MSCGPSKPILRPGSTPRDGGPPHADHEGASPARSGARQRNLESAIQRRELGLRVRLGVRRELLAQRKLDDRLLITASEEGEATAKECRPETEQSLHRDEIVRCPGSVRV